MTNPYQAPQSDVAVDEIPSKTKWKVFFWIVLTLELLGLGWMLFEPSQTATDVILDALVYCFVLTGLFCFAYDRKVFFSRLWVIVALMGFCYDCYALYAIGWEDFETQQEMFFVLGFTIALLAPLMFFQYLALYLYAFRSPNIWNGEPLAGKGHT